MGFGKLHHRLESIRSSHQALRAAAHAIESHLSGISDREKYEIDVDTQCDKIRRELLVMYEQLDR